MYISVSYFVCCLIIGLSVGFLLGNRVAPHLNQHIFQMVLSKEDVDEAIKKFNELSESGAPEVKKDLATIKNRVISDLNLSTTISEESESASETYEDY